jgi:hypothetical protein
VRLLGMVTVKETVDKYTLFPEFHTWSRLEDPHSHRHGAYTTEDPTGTARILQRIRSQSAHSQLTVSSFSSLTSTTTPASRYPRARR